MPMAAGRRDIRQPGLKKEKNNDHGRDDPSEVSLQPSWKRCWVHLICFAEEFLRKKPGTVAKARANADTGMDEAGQSGGRFHHTAQRLLARAFGTAQRKQRQCG